jgi:L-threonylcarbamoyladenylate synthase
VDLSSPGLAPVIRVDPDHPDQAALERGGRLLREGGLVAFPTETVYGLGANALDDAAVRRVFSAKGRSPDDPLIVHLGSIEQLGLAARDVSAAARALAERFWPGPLTLVLPKQPAIPDSATAGLPSVAVRVPRHPIALGLIRSAGVPVVAPSANLFMRTSATTAAHVLDDLGARIDLIVDGGPTRLGIESTVAEVSPGLVRVLRPGATTVEQIAEALERLPDRVSVAVGGEKGGRSASPGMMTKHYAPRARVLLFSGSAPRSAEAMCAAARIELAQGRRVGLLVCDEDVPLLGDLVGRALVEELGPCSDLGQIARRLYAGMRRLDDAGVDTICVRDFGREGLGLAILDRLTRAAGQYVVRVD